MDEILKTLASQTGLDPATAKNGLGAVIAFLKEHLPPGMFGQVEQSVPDTQVLVDSFEANKTEGGGSGLLAAASGMVGKLLGGGGAGAGAAGATQLVSMLKAAGLDLTQIQNFLPKVIEMLQAHLPADLIEKVKGMVLGGGSAESVSE